MFTNLSKKYKTADSLLLPIHIIKKHEVFSYNHIRLRKMRVFSKQVQCKITG